MQIVTDELCPHCKRPAGVPLLWGVPLKEEFEAEDCGEVVLGGCDIPERDRPTLACLKCKYRW